jgi:hypothetical protein
VLKSNSEREAKRADQLEEQLDELKDQAEEEVSEADEHIKSVSETVLETGLRMIEKQVDRVTSESAKSYDPIAVAKSVIEMTKEMKGDSGAGMLPFLTEMMRQQAASAEKQLEAVREEAKFWREKAMTAPAQPQANGSPKSFLEEMKEMADAKEVMRSLFGRERAPEREPAPEKPGFLEGLVSNPAFLGVADKALSLGMQLLMTRLTPTPADPNTLRQTLAGNPPGPQLVDRQPAPPAEPTQEQRMREMTLQFLKTIEKPFIAHFFDMEQQGLDGYTFAHAMHCEFVHSGSPTQNGRAQYMMIRDQWGPRFDALIKQYPPLWEMLQGHANRYKKFLEEFANYDQEFERRQSEEEVPPAAVAH